jgi:hypothetical protein
LLLVFIVAAAAAAVGVTLARDNGGGAAKDCFSKSPTVHPKQVENDLRALERLACR